MIYRSIVLVALSSFGFTPAIDARTPPSQVDPSYLATIVDDEKNPLPRGPAPWERGFPGYPPPVASTPPKGRIRAQAEYEPSAGIFIRWGSYNALHTSMVVPLTTADPPATVFIVVSGQSQENAARSVLQNAQPVPANMQHVRFVHTDSDSVWIRDYGPRFIENNGRLAIVDHRYNRNRPADDAVPAAVAAAWNLPLFNIGLAHGGGNFHLFRSREALMTRLVANENADYGITEQDIVDRYAIYQGLDLMLTDPFPISYDSTQHIDMWMLPLADNTILVSEYPKADTVPHAITEAIAVEMATRGYDVFRTPGWNDFGTHYTYANSVIVNHVALICRFGGNYAAQDAQALSVYQIALPDHDIVQVDCSGIIHLAGAIHCIVMHVPDLLFRDPFEDDL